MALQQHHVVLFLRVLLVGLEADGLAEEFLQLGHRRRLFVGDLADHLGRGDHQQLRGLELAHRAGDLAEDFVGERFGGLERAAAAALMAGFAQLALQAFGGALARHLHQAQRRELVHRGAGVVVRQALLERAQHLALVLVVGHVDEVDDDDAAQIAQPQLARHRLRRLEVGAVHRFFQVALAQERTGVHVHRGHGLGLVDDQVAAGLERHLLLHRAQDLVLDAVQVEDGPLAGVVFDALGQRRHELVRRTR